MEKAPLYELIDQHLAAARAASSGRSAHTLFGGHAATLRQTLIGLAGGQKLDEHENPGEATVQVLHGRVRLAVAEGEAEEGESRNGGPNPDLAATVGPIEGDAGDLLVVPDARHSLEALTDAVILLTVAKLPG